MQFEINELSNIWPICGYQGRCIFLPLKEELILKGYILRFVIGWGWLLDARN